MHDTITALKQIVDDAVTGLDATVTDGPPSSPTETAIGVSVGLGFNDEPPITLSDDPIGAKDRSDAQLVVRCLAMVQAPVDADLTTVRAQLIDVVARIDAAIAADMTLSGTAALAWIGGTQRFWPGRTNEAAIYTAAFDIHAQILN